MGTHTGAELPRDYLRRSTHPAINECPANTAATTREREREREREKEGWTLAIYIYIHTHIYIYTYIYSGDILLLLDHVLASFQRDNVFAMCR